MDRNSYEALHHSAAWIDLTGRGKIRAMGEDRARLLHSMTTAHIEELVPGAGCYAFFLTAQGRILADAHVFAMPDYLLIDTEPETKQRVFEHLDKFIIADDVILRDFTNDYATLNVEGPHASQVLAKLGAPLAHSPCSIAVWSHSEVAHVSYTGQPGYSFFVPCEHMNDAIANLADAGVVQAEIATADVVRIENAKPRYGVDMNETSIPQETQQMHAVHPAKGCYIGQEIVERVRARGHLNKMLYPLVIEGTDVPSAGAPIHSNGKDVGAITSAVYSPIQDKVVAFGIVRTEAVSSHLTVNGAATAVRRAGH
jgi:folate-binding protein YgfZ